MEKNYVVMTDSSADLNPALEQELGVDIIPLSVNCGDRTFLDYPDEREIKTSEFYGMLRSGANAKTAAANVETFLTAMSRHLEQGKDVLYLGFSSGLSSTYSASEIAAQELRERYPERKVLTVDTLCASMGQGLLVWLTVQELKHGATLEEAAKYAEDNRLHLCHWFTVDDLFFLKQRRPRLGGDGPRRQLRSASSPCSMWTTKATSSTSRRPAAAKIPSLHWSTAWREAPLSRKSRPSTSATVTALQTRNSWLRRSAAVCRSRVSRSTTSARSSVRTPAPAHWPCSSSEQRAEPHRIHRINEKPLRSIARIAAVFQISLLPSSARSSVTSSAYSSWLPTGMP